MRAGVVLILAVLLVILDGCRSGHDSQQSSAGSRSGGQQSQSPVEPPLNQDSGTPPTAAVHDARPLIVCFGDSLTAGYGTEAGQSYPDYLQSDLDHAGYAYRVVNAGISGNTTKDGLGRVDSVVAMKPAIVVVEFGGNDGLRGFRIEDTRANLEKILSTLQASGSKVVLAGITLPPDYGQDYIRQFNQTYVLLAKKFNVPLSPFILQGVFGVDGMMQADHIHATAAGNQIVARNILALVHPLLRRGR